jgi:hypothetical protein
MRGFRGFVPEALMRDCGEEGDIEEFVLCEIPMKWKPTLQILNDQLCRDFLP